MFLLFIALFRKKLNCRHRYSLFSYTYRPSFHIIRPTQFHSNMFTFFHSFEIEFKRTLAHFPCTLCSVPIFAWTFCSCVPFSSIQIFILSSCHKNAYTQMMNKHFFSPIIFRCGYMAFFSEIKCICKKQSFEIYILTQSSGTHATHTLTTVDETNMNVVCVTHLLISIWQAFVVDILLSYSGLSRAKRSARRFVVKARVDEREKIQADRVCSKVIRLYGWCVCV